MLTFQEMHLTVHKRGSGEGMVALMARQQPTVGDPDAPAREAGINYLSFYFTHEEFEGLLTGKLTGCNDIGHNVRACGDLLTFFDMEFSSDVRGVMRVPFVNVHLPYYVRRVLLRAVRMTLARCRPEDGSHYDERKQIRIPYALRERWVRQYGQGTGKVKLDVAYGSEEFFRMCEEGGGETFARCIDGLKRIASNQTARHTDVATVDLRKDWDGWYFRILTPEGRCTLNGGVINHGRDGAQSWSAHT